jgi:anti-sigma factor RsiW
VLFRRREIACRQAVDLMTDYLEGALSPRDRTRLEAHLADCDYCVEYLAQIRATIDIAGRIEPEDLEPEVLDELVSLYRRWQSS